MSDTLVHSELYATGIDVAYHEDRFTKAGKERVKPLRWYEVNGERVPSVTEVLDVLHKPALTWWGQTIGIDGVQELSRRGYAVLDSDAQSVCDWLTAEKLTVNHVRDSAARRGQGAHDALHAFATKGTIPDLRDYPMQDRGYVQGLASFLLTEKPEFINAEVVVGSVEHGYAGRYDLRVRIGGREVLCDLKTSKRAYESHHLQLAAYDAAAQECGFDPTDAQVVLRVGEDGSYELVESCATVEDFAAVKQAFCAQESLAARIKARKKGLVAA